VTWTKAPTNPTDKKVTTRVQVTDFSRHSAMMGITMKATKKAMFPITLLTAPVPKRWTTHALGECRV
jgi:hypothetical protein